MSKFIQQIKKYSSSIFFSFIIIFVTTDVYADNTAKKACDAAGVNTKSLSDIQIAAFETIDNMLPIKIGGIEVGSPDDVSGGLASAGGSSSDNSAFLCMCQMPPPVFERLGVSISFWNNVGMVDTSSIPYCFPQLGMSLSEDIAPDIESGFSILGKPGVGGANQFGTRSNGSKDSQFITAHTHFASFMNLMQIISEAIFSMCLGISTNISPIMSETAFWWQVDEWGVVKNPEALLVANPIATTACMAESVSMIAKKNLDPLFWCMGSWGSLYPITMNVGSGTPLTSYAMLAARNLAERFQLGMLMDTTGYQMLNGYCQPIPIYFTPKSDINIFPIWPQKSTSRFPLGYPSEFWGVGKDNPTNLGVMTWMVYQKRDCCYL